MLDYVHSYAAMGLTGLTDFILPFLVVLSILVFVHEWGHYIVARYYGVRVDVFSIGFGKELFGWTDNSGTRWKVSLIPLGGYVQMFGDTDPSSHNNKYEMTEENKQLLLQTLCFDEDDPEFWILLHLRATDLYQPLLLGTHAKQVLH